MIQHYIRDATDELLEACGALVLGITTIDEAICAGLTDDGEWCDVLNEHRERAGLSPGSVPDQIRARDRESQRKHRARMKEERRG